MKGSAKDVVTQAQKRPYIAAKSEPPVPPQKPAPQPGERFFRDPPQIPSQKPPTLYRALMQKHDRAKSAR